MPLLLLESGIFGVPCVVFAAALIGHSNVGWERVPYEADCPWFQAVHGRWIIAVTVSWDNQGHSHAYQLVLPFGVVKEVLLRAIDGNLSWFFVTTNDSWSKNILFQNWPFCLTSCEFCTRRLSHLDNCNLSCCHQSLFLISHPEFESQN